MRARSALFLLPWLLSLSACTSSPPPRWATGGAPLVLGRAQWKTGTGMQIELLEDGRVLADGALFLSLDRAGRVYDGDNEPVAILLPDGHIAGADNAALGRIGATNASPPGYGTAWFAVLPDGSVIHFDPDGERSTDGVWRGCEGPVHRTCTLITQLVTLERVAAASRGTVFLGFGMGVYR